MAQSKNLLEKVKALCNEGNTKEVIKLIESIKHVNPSACIECCVLGLQGCSKIRLLTQGKLLHAHLLKIPLEPTVYMLNTIINMYAKCGSLEDAHHIFDKMPTRNVFTWTLLITGHIQHGDATEAIKVFRYMQQENIKPSIVTMGSILNACACIPSLGQGKHVHAHVLILAHILDGLISNTLIDMYVKAGSIPDAQIVFDRLPTRDVITWSTIIAGYIQQGFGKVAIELYRYMKLEGIKADDVTFACITGACACLLCFGLGKHVHACIIKTRIPCDFYLGSILVDMYAKCGSIEAASQVFDIMVSRDTVTWNTLISGYTQNGKEGASFSLFRVMQNYMKPNEVTLVTTLSACACCSALLSGRYVHATILKMKHPWDISLGNSLIDMYAKCGSILDALEQFCIMPMHDVVSWNAIIAGYIQHGDAKAALKLYFSLQSEGIKPNKAVFATILGASAVIGAFELGKWVHSDIVMTACELDIYLGSSLVDMYAKCGNIEAAGEVFDMLPMRDVVAWSAMIGGYAQNGYGRKAINLLRQMQLEGIQPDKVTLTSAVYACNQANQDDEGFYYFDLQNCDIQHAACVADLLGRAGYLDEAGDFLNTMMFEPNVEIQMSLLGLCKMYGDVEIPDQLHRDSVESVWVRAC